MRSLLLEPSTQRVYHVVFANSSHIARYRAQVAVAIGVSDQRGREALDLLL